MSEQGSESPSFPVERFPGPVCRYVFRDGTPVILSVNSSFENQFGAVRAEVSLSAAFESLGIDVLDGDDSVTTPENIDRVAVGTPGRSSETALESYLVRNVMPSDDTSGFLVFVESAGTELVGERDSPLDGDHIATIISHDLRNPLDVAKSRLHAGVEYDEDEHFEHVEWAHERMERIIDDVLTLAKMGQEPDQYEEFDLESVTRTAWRTVENEDVTLTVTDELPRVVAAQDRVLRLFENLFRNCAEHGSERGPTEDGDTTDSAEGTPDGRESESHESVSVTVGPLEGTSTDGFYVADDGPGIPPEERTAVFDPGYSFDGDGTGLGLSIVARIVDAHGWSIEVTTGADGGARFEVTGLQVPDTS